MENQETGNRISVKRSIWTNDDLSGIPIQDQTVNFSWTFVNFCMNHGEIKLLVNLVYWGLKKRKFQIGIGNNWIGWKEMIFFLILLNFRSTFWNFDQFQRFNVFEFSGKEFKTSNFCPKWIGFKSLVRYFDCSVHNFSRKLITEAENWL